MYVAYYFHLKRSWSVVLLIFFLMYQAVLETVARVVPKKNESKEEKYAPLSSKVIIFLIKGTEF